MKRHFIFLFVFSVYSSSCLRVNHTIQEPQALRYLALGDSYTIGEGVDENMRWPVLLSEELSQQGLNISKTDIIATSGWTSNDLLNAIQKEQPANYDLVSLLIGVNNQYQNISFSTFTKELDELLQIAIGLAGEKRKVFVVSIPDYGVTPFGAANRTKIREELDQYNEYTRQICKSLDIPHIDITEISRKLEGVDGALAADNLHPGGMQYGKWIEKIMPVVKALLKK